MDSETTAKAQWLAMQQARVVGFHLFEFDQQKAFETFARSHPEWQSVAYRMLQLYLHTDFGLSTPWDQVALAYEVARQEQKIFSGH